MYSLPHETLVALYNQATEQHNAARVQAEDAAAQLRLLSSVAAIMRRKPHIFGPDALRGISVTLGGIAANLDPLGSSDVGAAPKQ